MWIIFIIIEIDRYHLIDCISPPSTWVLNCPFHKLEILIKKLGRKGERHLISILWPQNVHLRDNQVQVLRPRGKQGVPVHICEQDEQWISQS